MIQTDKAAIQRENILRTAYGLFKVHGNAGTTTREIAAAAGINKGSLHYYYKQKDDIVIDIYQGLLAGLADFTKREIDTGNGLVDIATLDILFFRLFSSPPDLLDLLSELIMKDRLTRLKIDQAVALILEIVNSKERPITEYQLRLAVTAAVGAESQLFLSIRDGHLKMTFDKLATTISKLMFTMLKVEEDKIRQINIHSL